MLILHTLSSGAQHGYGIAKTIREQSNGVLDFAEGTLYPTLHDLEKQGYLEAFEEQVNGRSRRSYRLTAAGKQALEQERAEWEQFAGVIDAILGAATS